MSGGEPARQNGVPMSDKVWMCEGCGCETDGEDCEACMDDMHEDAMFPDWD